MRYVLITPETIFQIYSSSHYYCTSDDGYFRADLRSQFVSILDLKEEKVIFHLEEDGSENGMDQEKIIANVALSPNGKFVFVGNDSGNSYVYGIDSQAILSTINLNHVSSAKWSSDSTHIAVARRTGSVLIIDLKGNVLNSFSLATRDSPTSMTWSPDNSLLAVGDASGHIVILTVSKIKDGTQQTYKQKNTIVNLTFSPDGALLAGFDYDSEGNRSLNVWNVRELTRIYELRDNDAFYWMAPQWSPDGSILGIGFQNANYRYGVIFLNTSSWEKKTYGQDWMVDTGLRAFRFSPDQKAFFLILESTDWPDHETWQLTQTVISPFYIFK